ncbi:protein CHROMOSOME TRANSMISSION FIDELITY 7-like isoform X2 [Asparagus officinalis]|uniref:protein CHROMOSOME TRANSMISSION FIDELITY 7-like isoform X2 n=1 Tax=Asparagus officinalis TaxID=4686 RepID=UPI00098E266F|nr:protein CHROMOSOME TRANSMISSION FIDELITY 7-like isoform X2 [Asparagus officinalis]
MQQSKISAFFRPCCPKNQNPNQIQIKDLSKNQSTTTPIVDEQRDLKLNSNRERSDTLTKSVGKILNNKRSYAQYHLELGQSNFLLHTCSVCGLMYARGDERDERLHKFFHKEYEQGIAFKGWSEERVVSRYNNNGDRILLVLDGDPPAQKHKVKQVINMTEKELGFVEGELNHKLCKVYLFISSHRVIGCLVAEPIKTAHRVIPAPSSTTDKISKNSKNPNKSILQFGQFNFQREVINKYSSENTHKFEQWEIGAMLCEEEALPATCGVRAIWVAPSKRRKRIASLLLDAARMHFRRL